MKRKEESDKFLTPEEFRKFLEEARNKSAFWYLFFRTHAMLGTRIGEICLLQWKDLDLKNSRVKIPTLKRGRKSATELKKDYLGRKHYVEMLWIELEDEDLLDIFKTLKEEHEPGEEDLLFKTSKRAAQNMFKKICTSANLNPKYSTHAFRHLHGLVTYETTGDLLKTANRLRHKKPATATIYIHLLEGEKRDIAKAVKSHLLGEEK